jgi:hypothetical protein
MASRSFLRGSVVGAATLFAAVAGLPATSHADRIFTLTTCNASLGCGGANNFGTVTVHQVSTGVVSVDVDLATGVTWAATGLIGFEFQLASGLATPTLSNVSANWTPTSGNPLTSFNGDGMGAFQYGLDFTGSTGTVSADLIFRLTATNLTENSFVLGGASGLPGNPQFYFAADICTPNSAGACSGSTGLVGATAAVPGPIAGAGLPGLVAACSGLLVLARRRRQRIA